REPALRDQGQRRLRAPTARQHPGAHQGVLPDHSDRSPGPAAADGSVSARNDDVGNAHTVTNPMISIIILSYRNPALIRLCLKSLAAVIGRDENIEVIVVDNASTPETRAVVTEEFS